MNQLYRLVWRDPKRGGRQQWDVLAKHKGEAVVWLLRQRPYLIPMMTEIEVGLTPAKRR